MALPEINLSSNPSTFIHHSLGDDGLNFFAPKAGAKI